LTDTKRLGGHRKAVPQRLPMPAGRETEPTSQEQPVNAATAAAWRRQLRAYQALPAHQNDDAKRPNGSPVEAGSAPTGSQHTIVRNFAESQQAGLGAIATTRPGSTVNPLDLPPDRLRSPRSPIVNTTSRQPAAVFAATGSARDFLGLPVRPAPVAPDGLPATAVQKGRTWGPNWSTRVPWPLVAMLVTQTVLALRLIWSNTAYLDEATYLYVGSQELSHWLHGTPVQDYQIFLSGSPALYPPIGAIANILGGLAAARVLSLLFMLGTTSFLYRTTSYLFGVGAAALATALFVILGITQFLSAFATYDPAALFLLTLSAYLVIGYRRGDTLTSAVLANLVAPAALCLADATKYVTVLWNPVIIGLAACGPVLAGRTWNYGLRRAANFTFVLLVLLGIGLMVGKAKYFRGIEYTTLNRSHELFGMGQPVSLVFRETWLWISIVLILSTVGMVIASVESLQGKRGVLTVLGILLLTASVAAPVEQARIGTTVALQKHLVFGAWFGCILAGYALRSILRLRALTAMACTFALTAGAWYYTGQASRLYHSWQPVSMTFVQELRSMVHPGQERYLLDQNVYLFSYYVGDGINSLQWKSSAQYSYTDPASGIMMLNGPAFADAIRRRVFTLIVLDPAGATGINRVNDLDVIRDISVYGGYHIVSYLPPSQIGSSSYYTVWRVNVQSRQTT
jgi:hypothetical protein